MGRTTVQQQIAFKLTNKSKENEVIRILHSATQNELKKDCFIESLIGSSHDTIRRALSQRKCNIVSITAFAEFSQFQLAWQYGTQSNDGKFVSHTYLPLKDINYLQPRKDQIRTTDIQIELTPESFIDIPVQGTNSKPRGGQIIILMTIETKLEEVRTPEKLIEEK